MVPLAEIQLWIAFYLEEAQQRELEATKARAKAKNKKRG